MVTDFFRAFSHSIETDTFKRLLTPSLNSAKSSNPVVRANSIELFKILVKINPSSTKLDLAVTELMSLPKSGKTSGPEHRVALYSMLQFLNPSPSVSESIVQIVPPLLAKETHDAATDALAAALPPHIGFLLQSNKALSSDTTALIAREMNNSKPAVRHAFCSLAGAALWENVDLVSDASYSFAKAVLPAFEASLKTVSSNPLTSSGGPLQGYIALSVLLGPLSRSGKFGGYSVHFTRIKSFSDSTLSSLYFHCRRYHFAQFHDTISSIQCIQTIVLTVG